MGQWKNLPAEVVLKIGQDLRSGKGETWMYANRQMYNLHLATEFHLLCKLSSEDKTSKLDQISNSPFKPGNFVNTIFIDFLEIPQDESNFDRSTDELTRLVAKCPNVKQLYFSRSNPESVNIKIWTYIMNVVMYSNWKLERLFIYDKDKQVYATSYFNCAYYMRESLRQLHLAQGTIGVRDMARLSEFPKLGMLTVEKNILKDVFDCESVLKYLPQLDMLTVHGFKSYHESNSQDNKVIDYVPTRLKYLTLKSYLPSTDNELQYLMNKYARVNSLEISGVADVSWPISGISKAMFISFLTFCFKLKIHTIEIISKSGESWLIDAYHKARQTIENQYTHFTIGYVSSILCHIRTGFELKFSQVKHYKTKKQTPSYSLNFSTWTEYHPVVRAILLNLHESIESLTIVSIGNDLAQDINDVLSNPPRNLKHIAVKRGRFAEYNNAENEGDRGQQIECLEIDNVLIQNYGVFTAMSKDFKQLDSLKFPSWDFGIPMDENQPVENFIDIKMPETAVDTFILDGLPNVNTFEGDDILINPVNWNHTMTILLSLILVEQEVSECYLFATPNESGVKISWETFRTLKRKLDRTETVVVSLHFKSSRRITVATKKNILGRKHSVSLTYNP